MDARLVSAAAAAARTRTAQKPAVTADRSSVITFRVTAAERSLLQAVALLQDESMSGFVRNSAIDIAKEIIRAEGVEELNERYLQRLDERAARSLTTLREFAADNEPS